MRVLKNILIALGLIIAALAIGGVIDRISPPRPGVDGAVSGMVGILIFGTTLWASISSYRLEFRRYKTGMSYHPATIFILHLMFWIVVFPYFLTVRDNIKDGSAELKDEFKHEAVSSPMPQAPTPRPVFGDTNPTPAVPPVPVRAVIPPPLPPLVPREAASMPAQPMPPPLPRPQAPSVEARFEQLQKLAQLREQGILTETEFQGEKQKILGQA